MCPYFSLVWPLKGPQFSSSQGLKGPPASQGNPCGRISCLPRVEKGLDPCHSSVLQGQAHINLKEAFKNLLSPNDLALHSFLSGTVQHNFPQRSKEGGDLFLSLRMVTSCPAAQWPWEVSDQKTKPLLRSGDREQKENIHNSSKHPL